MQLLSSCTLALAFSLSPQAVGQAPASSSATEVAGALQKKYDSIRDFSTDFLHQHEGGAVRRKREERGTLLLKKPGKMRWTYKSPDEKVFVSNGTRLYQYFRDDNRVILSDAPGDDQPAVLFLSGRGNLTRDFNVSFGKTPVEGSWILHLEPKQPQAEYDWLEITAAKDSLRLQALTVGEKTGSRSTFTFTNFKENPGLADNAFEFSIPKGAEVTNAAPVKR